MPIDHEKQRSRQTELDILRFIAIVGVLIIHSSTRFASSDIEKHIGAWFSIFSRPCVGIFLFISGFLLSKNYFDCYQLIRHFKRVLIPYTFFSILAFLYKYNIEIASIIYKHPFNIFFQYVFGNSFGIYYFVFIICINYILLFYSNNSTYDVILIFFSIVILVHTAYYKEIVSLLSHSFKFNDDVYINRYIFWPFFFFLGAKTQSAHLVKYLKDKKLYFIYFWIVSFLIYNVLFYFDFNNIDGYNSIIGTIYTIATIYFLFCMDIKSNSIIMYIGKMSYYLYLSHIFIVYIFCDGAKFYRISLPFWFSIVSFLMSLFIPLLFYEFQKKLFNNQFSKYLGVMD